MRFGLCGGLEGAEAAARAGWDYMEVGVGTFVPLESDSAYAEVRGRVASMPIPIEAANCFIPGHLRLTGPEVDERATLAYVDVALTRMAEAGVRIVVLGSGGARSLPEGWPTERGIEQLATFLQRAGRLADGVGMVIAVEPLRRAESNLLNRVREAVDLCAQVGHPAVRPLADLYHMTEEGESITAVRDLASVLAHVHVADTGRAPPGQGSGDLRGFLDALWGGGYAGRISVECSWRGVEGEQEHALATLRASWPGA